MSLSQIEYFVAVANAGNVGRASMALRVAQPAVSRQIRRLEDELGASLFVRTSRGMTLSAAGQRFLQHARGILEGVRQAEAEMRDLAPGTRR
jgi:LysR family nitrogen assimilation transcriptional regulator